MPAMLNWQVGPEWMFADSDPQAGRQTLARLFSERADEALLVIGSHFAAPTAGQIRRDGKGLKFVL